MMIKICCRCGTRTDIPGDKTYIVNIQYEYQDGLKWLLGMKGEVDLCKKCFSDFFLFLNPNEKI